MNIRIDTDSIGPMADWLRDKKNGNADKERLLGILELPAYAVELERYSGELPVCNLTKEEIVDFFLHFDEKQFENQRLQLKQPEFLKFYGNMDAELQKAEALRLLNEEDAALIMRLLGGALPDALLKEETDYTVIFTISVGNSQGYPHGNNIVFDVSNLSAFPSCDHETLAAVIAHEIHHTFFGSLLPEEFSPQALFAINFAFEGLAMHFCNNASTRFKPKKYSDLPEYGVCGEDFALYDSEADELFADFRRDLADAAGMSMDEVTALVSKKYEQFEYISRIDGARRAIQQYPTYYLGCWLWGGIDTAFGKETLLDTLSHPEKFTEVCSLAQKKLGNGRYVL